MSHVEAGPNNLSLGSLPVDGPAVLYVPPLPQPWVYIPPMNQVSDAPQIIEKQQREYKQRHWEAQPMEAKQIRLEETLKNAKAALIGDETFMPNAPAQQRELAVGAAGALLRDMHRLSTKEDIAKPQRKKHAGKSPVAKVHAEIEGEHKAQRLANRIGNDIEHLRTSNPDAYAAFERLQEAVPLPKVARGQGGLFGMDSVVESIVKLFYDSKKGGPQITGLVVGAAATAMGYSLTGGGSMGWLGLGTVALMGISGLVAGKMLGQMISKAMTPEKPKFNAPVAFSPSQEQTKGEETAKTQPAASLPEAVKAQVNAPEKKPDSVNGKPEDKSGETNIPQQVVGGLTPSAFPQKIETAASTGMAKPSTQYLG